MTTKIKSITEAFSTQPLYLCVGMTLSKGVCIKEITLSKIQIDDKEIEVCIGYGSAGQVLFEYFRASVNIIYEVATIVKQS